MDGHRRLGGAHGRGERGGLVAGGDVVVGDRGRAVRAAAAVAPRSLLERERDRAVQLGVLAGQQVVVDDLAQQRVAEGVEALLVGDDDVAGDRLAQRVAHLARVDPAGLLDQLVVHPLAGRQQPQQLLGVGGSDSMRSISASRSVGGSAPRPSRPAASSSSANSGLPSLRA